MRVLQGELWIPPEAQTQFVWLSIIGPWTLKYLEASRCRGASLGMDAAAGRGSHLLNTIKTLCFPGCNRKCRCTMTGLLWAFFLPTIQKTYIESSDISFFPPGFCWRGIKGCFKCTSFLKTGNAAPPAWCWWWCHECPLWGCITKVQRYLRSKDRVCWSCYNFPNYISAERWRQAYASPGNKQANPSMPPAPDNN